MEHELVRTCSRCQREIRVRIKKDEPLDEVADLIAVTTNIGLTFRKITVVGDNPWTSKCPATQGYKHVLQQ